MFDRQHIINTWRCRNEFISVFLSILYCCESRMCFPTQLNIKLTLVGTDKKFSLLIASVFYFYRFLFCFSFSHRFLDTVLLLKIEREKDVSTDCCIELISSQTSKMRHRIKKEIKKINFPNCYLGNISCYSILNCWILLAIESSILVRSNLIYNSDQCFHAPNVFRRIFKFEHFSYIVAIFTAANICLLIK